MSGFIELGLEAIFNGGNVQEFKTRKNGCTKGRSCGGDGAGC
jgi:hypothetical protein